MGTAMREELIRLLEPEVAAFDCELVELEFHAHHGGGLLRLYIDHPASVCGSAAGARPAAGGGVTVADCERVSRAVSAALDAADPIRGEYTLEVSSPGLDRPLRTPAHFARFRGDRVHVETSVARDGRRRWTGRLAEVGPAAVVLEVDGQAVELKISEIRTARLVPDFGTRRE